MNQRIDARIDPALLTEVKSEVAGRGLTFTQALEDGLRRWLKAVRRSPKVSE